AVQPGRGDQIAADDEEDRHRERPAVFVAGQQLDRLLGSAPGQRIAVDQQHQRSREETQEIEIVFPGVQRSVEMHCALRNGLFSRDCCSYWVKASFGPVCKRSAFPTGGRFVLSLRCLSRRDRSEEHTSELQSRENLECRLLLEKKKMLVYNLYLVVT